MVYPAVRMTQFYSVAFNESIEVIFPQLELINTGELKKYLDSKQSGMLSIAPCCLTLDLDSGSMSIVGYRISKTQWILTEDGRGDITIFKHGLSNENIHTAITYLYHMYANLTAVKS